MSNLSLMAIMRNDPDFGKRLSKKVQEIKQDKENILTAADVYGKQYQNEIIEGTELKAKLLTEGSSKGLNEEQVMCEFGRFVPTVYTPLLNMLYFMLRESENDPYFGNKKYNVRNRIDEQLVKLKQLDHENDSGDVTMEEFNAMLNDVEKHLYTETKDERRETLNSKFNDEKKDDPNDGELKQTPDMVEFLYGNITLDVFNKIKKLKALSKSSNEQEAFQAYRKALEMCKQHNLEFDKIPCYVDKK